jgi:hypothetical protein
MPRDNSKANREGRKARAAERLAASKKCTVKGCTSVHVDGHK